jgi:hypothetical protein
LVRKYPNNLEVSNEAKNCECYGGEIPGGVRNMGNETHITIGRLAIVSI